MVRVDSGEAVYSTLLFPGRLGLPREENFNYLPGQDGAPRGPEARGLWQMEVPAPKHGS